MTVLITPITDTAHPSHMNSAPQPIITRRRTLSTLEYKNLSDAPPEVQWLANLSNQKTRRAYRIDIQSFMQFAGITNSKELQTVKRSHILAWRCDMETQGLSGATIRRRMSALSSLFESLCDSHDAIHNPTRGVKRPRVDCLIGKTPALSKEQARALLDAPDDLSLKGMRDKAILAMLLHHALRREELCSLKVRDFKVLRGGSPHIRVRGKGDKIRFLPIHPESEELVTIYIVNAGHHADADGPLFRSVSSAQKSAAVEALTPNGIYSNVVRYYLNLLGINGELMGPHALRCTAATCALDNQADIAQVQEWLGHTNISTTRIYDRRNFRVADSPTFKVSY